MEIDPNTLELGLKVLGGVGALIGLTLAWRAHADRSTFEMIDRLYTLCHTLQSYPLKDWRLAHLFSIGRDEYHRVTARIRQQLLDERELAEYRVKERQYAIHIFVVYEQVYYQWRHSSRIAHRRRRRFLNAMLSYFRDRLLLNPRLLHYLKEDRDGASLHLELCSKHYIDDAIADKEREAGEALWVDHDGPFQHMHAPERVEAAGPPAPMREYRFTESALSLEFVAAVV